MRNVPGLSKLTALAKVRGSSDGHNQVITK
jgi:hypothetical protein